MPIPRIYAPEVCPLDGYDSLSIAVLQNSTDADMADWNNGGLGGIDCPKCAKLRAPKVVRGRRAKAPAVNPQASSPAIYCADCQKARSRFGTALVAFFGTNSGDMDFSTPSAALVTMDRDDLPAEIVMWLFLLPQTVRARRFGDLEKNLLSSLTTPTTPRS
jgi:hypothetical protein